jgi:hypothetical protein
MIEGRIEFSQQLLDTRCQESHALRSRIHNEVSDLAIQGIALFVQRAQPAKRVCSLQQRAITVATSAAPQIFRRGTQINDPSSALQ